MKVFLWKVLVAFCLLSNAVNGQTNDITSNEMTTNDLTSSQLTTNQLTTVRMSTGRMTTSPMTTSKLTTAQMTTSQFTSFRLTSSQITSSQMTTSKFTSAAMTTDEITSAPLTTSKFTSAALTTSKITTAAMTTAAVTSNQFTSAALTTDEFTSSAMTTDEMTTSEMTTASFTTNEMTTNEVTTSQLTTSIMTTSEMTTASFTTNEMTTNEVTTSQLTTSIMTTNEMTSSQMTSSPLTSSAISTNGMTTSQITSGHQVTTSPQALTTSSVPTTVNVTKNMTVTIITITLPYNSISQVNQTALIESILKLVNLSPSEAYRVVIVTSAKRNVDLSFFFAPSLNGKGSNSQVLTDVLFSTLSTNRSALGSDFVLQSSPMKANSTQEVIINTPILATTGVDAVNNGSTSSAPIVEPSEKSDKILGLPKTAGTVVIVIIVVGGILVAILVIVIVVLLVKRRKRSKHDHNPQNSVSMIDVKNHSEPAPSPSAMPPIKEKDLEFPVEKVSERCEELRLVVTAVGANGFDVEFNHIEKKSAVMANGEEYKEANRPDNLAKNRYRNVLPPSHTRIILKTSEDEPSDFINANYVSGIISGSEKAYIATQGPLPTTVSDFWRMIWDTDAQVIMNLTKEMENGKVKCEKYWPSEDKPMEVSKFKITLKESTGDPEVLLTRVFLLEHTVKNEQRTVTQLHYVAWPDHGVPESTGAYLELSQKADILNTTAAPIVVHCSAGIGRSGTFCLVHSVLEVVKEIYGKKGDKVKDHKINICDTLLKIRLQRSNMVQTSEQYEFCYHAIRDGVKKILAGDFEKSFVKTNPTESESDKSQKSDSDEDLPPPPYDKEKDNKEETKEKKSEKKEKKEKEESEESSPEKEKKKKSKKAPPKRKNKESRKRRDSTSSGSQSSASQNGSDPSSSESSSDYSSSESD